MTATQETDIRAALTAAHAAGEDWSEPVTIIPDQRDSTALLEAALVGAGLDPARFEAIQRQARADLDRSVAERKAEDARHATPAIDDLLKGINDRVEAIEHLAEPTGRYLLESPYMIVPSAGLTLLADQIEPKNSSAKFHFHSEASAGGATVTFYYMWVSPDPAYSVITIHGYLIAKGYCLAGSEGGFWPGDRRSNLTLEARLNVLEWWNQPPTQPPFQVNQIQPVASLHTSTGGFLDPGAIEAKNVYRAYDLSHELLVIPPGGVAVLGVTLALGSGTSEGSVDADFATGDYSVISPYVLVATLT